MKKIIVLSLLVFLSGCFGPEKFDATNENTIKESSQEIMQELSSGKKKEFQKALMYFSIGGKSGISSIMKRAFSGDAVGMSNEAQFNLNLQVIDGLTGDEVISKHQAEIERDKIIDEKRKQEERKVSALKKEAEQLLDSRKFKKALEKYEEMNQVPAGVRYAQAGIENVKEEMHEFTEKNNYMDKVVITEFEAKRIDTYTKKSVPAVRLSIKNTGNKSLDRVKIVVYFKNEKGVTIFEEEYNPVLVSKYSYGDSNKPLKAGYVKEMEQDKYYTLDTPLTDWAEGKAVAQVVDIEFSE
ncbi:MULTISPECIES: DUF6694 family lipoprotein [Cobetia]|uniref:DUF6694 family lipoprotein n=1 Tax=Cobetia TaxID=204286 RepID=UPI000987D48E|nr:MULTISPECIES: DUF6694 family lipoprotein [Cobetia]POR07223.1 hypothetical protein BOH68_06405 [Cobetia sp. MM1IDA2H-1]